MFAELIATEGVREIHRPGSHIGVMAIHGGIEEGTAVIAESVAVSTGASLYAVVQPDDLWWHVPSTRYDPADSPRLAEFIGSISTAISLHGYGQPGLEGTALLGGNNRSLAQAIAAEFAAAGIAAIADVDEIPKRLRGTHHRNPVNLPPDSGVQIELPMELREGEPRQLVESALATVVRRASEDRTPPTAG